MIPAIIFQTWKSKVSLPPIFARWSATFKCMNPDYSYELWDDEDNRRFIERDFPWISRIYESYSAEIYRADIIRYFYLYAFGGIYVDMDTKCVRSLDSLRELADVIVGRMGDDPEFAHSIPNAFMASSPKQEY